MALNPTAKDKAAFLSPLVRKFKLSSSQLLAMHTTQVSNVVAAVPRYVIVPRELYLMHPAGTAYANASSLQLRWGTTVIGAAALAGFHDVATAGRLFCPSMVNSGASRALLDPETAVNQVGVSINALLSAQVTTGNFAIYGLLVYRLMPSNLVQS